MVRAVAQPPIAFRELCVLSDFDDAGHRRDASRAEQEEHVRAWRSDLAVGRKLHGQVADRRAQDLKADVALVHVEVMCDGACADEDNTGDLSRVWAADRDVVTVPAMRRCRRDPRTSSSEEVWRGEELEPVLEVLVGVALELPVLAPAHYPAIGKQERGRVIQVRAVDRRHPQSRHLRTRHRARLARTGSTATSDLPVELPPTTRTRP